MELTKLEGRPHECETINKQDRRETNGTANRRIFLSKRQWRELVSSCVSRSILECVRIFVPTFAPCGGAPDLAKRFSGGEGDQYFFFLPKRCLAPSTKTNVEDWAPQEGILKILSVGVVHVCRHFESFSTHFVSSLSLGPPRPHPPSSGTHHAPYTLPTHPTINV